MQKQITKNIIIIAALFISSTNFAIAAPSISGTSGSFSSGQSVTVSGSGFGTKSTAAPIKFDNFENGTSGINLYQTDPLWVRYLGGSDTGVIYNNTFAHSGSLSVYNPVQPDNNGDFSTNYYMFPATDEVWYSYWWRTSNLAGLTDQNNTKLGRIGNYALDENPYNGAGTTSLTTYMWADDQPPNYVGSPYLAYWVDGSGENLVPGDGLYIEFNQWNRIDCHKKLSYPGGTANGTVECWSMSADNSSSPFYLGSKTLVNRPAGQTWQQDCVLLGAMDGAENQHDYQIYIDDVYIDNTIARVEVCDSASWSTRTHCEVQPATSWNAAAVISTVNQGTFAGGSSQYLYVVDSNGDANANGYQITFGADTTAPANPSGLSVN